MKKNGIRQNRRRPDRLIGQLAEEIGRDLSAIRQILRRPAETAFASGRLTGPQCTVMQVLFHSNGMSLKAVSKNVGLAHSTVCGIIDRLEQRGMVERRPDEADGRVTVLRVSRQVRDFMRNKLPALTAHPLVEAMRRATPAEQESILTGLRLLRNMMEPQSRTIEAHIPCGPTDVAGSKSGNCPHVQKGDR